MNVVMELGDGSCLWHVVGGAAGVGGDDDEEDEPQQQPYEGYEAGSADYYRHVSQGDWQAYQGAWMGWMHKEPPLTRGLIGCMITHCVRCSTYRLVIRSSPICRLTHSLDVSMTTHPMGTSLLAMTTAMVPLPSDVFVIMLWSLNNFLWLYALKQFGV